MQAKLVRYKKTVFKGRKFDFGEDSLENFQEESASLSEDF